MRRAHSKGENIMDIRRHKTALAVAAAIAATSLTLPRASFSAAPPAAAKADAKAKPVDKKTKAMADDIIKDFKERLKHRFAPVVKKVTVGSAKAGQPISITVQAAYDDSRAIDKINEVRVYYSADGGKKWEKPVKLSKSGADWKGAIPAQQKGNLNYYISIKDSQGNVTSELPCKVTSWPPVDDGCMVRGAVDRDPVDDKPNIIENDLDVWEFKIGMDDNYIYLRQSVQGAIRKGTLSPSHINIYAAFVLDLWALKQADDVMGLLGGGGADADQKDKAKKLEQKFKGKENMLWFLIYSPLLKSMWPDAKDCFAPRQPKPQAGKKKGEAAMAMPVPDNKNLTCSAKGPDLFLRLNKAPLSDTMKKEFIAIGAFTLPMTEPFPMGLMTGFKKGDMLNITRAVWNPRTLKVN